MIAQIGREYLCHGLGHTLRCITNYALCEGRPLTTKGRFINPMMFDWLNTLSVLQGEGEVERPIFITAMGRSGTTTLGILLALHSDVGYLNEPKGL